MDESTPQTTLSIPSLLAFAVISFLAIRYFFFSSPSSSTNPTALQRPGRSGRTATVPAGRVEQVAAMFPQLSVRDVEWDLLRNGGSVQATTERVLREGRLPAAPPNFHPQTTAPPPTNSTSTTSSSSSSSSSSAPGTRKPQPQTTHPDLITRYNLSSRITTTTTEAEPEAKKKEGWSQNKVERQALLTKRRDEMILEARRKMEERERKGKEKAGV